jgi:hypothetical protein
MRKPSITAACGRGKFQGEQLTIGLDLGDRSSFYCVLNGAGVAHARNVRLIGESRRKDDRLDAQTSARLARIDPQLLSPIQHRSAQAQADLSVI